MSSNETTTNYDDSGAMIYIVIVLLWYSTGIIFMLAMQMRARSELIEEATRRRTKFLIRNLRDQNHTKEILEELVDKNKRARLWDIYRGRNGDTPEKINDAESARIRNIEKQLENINRTRRMTNENIFPPIEKQKPRSNIELRRRSSCEPQRLETIQQTDEQEKSNDQIPWNMRKILIRRYFRRPTKKSSTIVSQNSTNSEILMNSVQNVTNSTLQTSDEQIRQNSIDEARENPYITYFYKSNQKSTHRPSIFDATFFTSPKT